MIENYGRTQGLDPCEILVEKEKRQEIVQMIKLVLSKLSPKEREIFYMYCIDKMTFEQIGEHVVGEYKKLLKNASGYKSKKTEENKRIALTKIGIKELQRITAKIKQKCTPVSNTLCKDLLLPNESMEEASTPKHHIGWLGTRLMKVNNGGYWSYNKHRDTKEYKSKHKCAIDTYTEGICSQCGIKCTNKEMKPRAKFVQNTQHLTKGGR